MGNNSCSSNPGSKTFLAMRNAFLISIIIFLGIQDAWAFSQAQKINEGNSLFQKGDYLGSAMKYQQVLEKDPLSDIAHFNLGAAYYKQGDFQKAIQHLQESLLGDHPQLKGKSHYNLGNTFYKSGLSQERTNLSEAIESLEQSLDHYQQALAIDPRDEDAQYNHELVKKDLQRLQQRQVQQQNQGSSGEKDKGDQQDQAQTQDQEQQQDSQHQDAQKPDDNLQDEKQDSLNQKSTPQEKTQSEENQDDVKKGEDGKEENPNQKSSQQKDHQKSQEWPDSVGGTEASDGTGDPSELTRSEAEMLLKDYQQNEEPHVLLNFFKSEKWDEPVYNDW